MSPSGLVNTVSASSRGVPRRHLLTTSGKPAADIDPSPKSVPTSTVFSASQLTSDLAAGRLKPSATNFLAAMSNSRTTAASEPPGDREISARVYSGSMTSAPAHTQFSSSAAASASMSMMTSQSGESRQYSSRVVRRHSPRGCSASVQKLYRYSPRRLTPEIRSLESATSSASARMRSNRSPLSSASVVSLFCLTQSSACSQVMSSNHRYGSSSTIVTPQRKHSDKRLKDSYQTTDPCAAFAGTVSGAATPSKYPRRKVHTIESRPAPPFPHIRDVNGYGGLRDRGHAWQGVASRYPGGADYLGGIRAGIEANKDSPPEPLR